jgi:hypothetical protein
VKRILTFEMICDRCNTGQLFTVGYPTPIKRGWKKAKYKYARSWRRRDLCPACSTHLEPV